MSVNRWRKCVVRGLACIPLVAGFVMFGPAGQAAAFGGQLQNSGTWLCADLPADGSSGVPLSNNPCNGSTTQLWGRDTSSPAFWQGRYYYHLVNFASGQCIGVANGSQSSGAWVVQWPCTNIQNQYWTPIAYSQPCSCTPLYIWANLGSGKCMRPFHGYAAEGTPMEQYNCDGTNVFWYPL